MRRVTLPDGVELACDDRGSGPVILDLHSRGMSRLG